MLSNDFSSECEEVVGELHQTLRAGDAKHDTFLTKNRFACASVDLDHDNSDEVVVSIFSAIFCGSGPSCGASIFTRSQSAWEYIGKIDVQYRPKFKAYELTRLHKNKLGWSVLFDGLGKVCWVPVTDPKKDYLTDDFFGLFSAKGRGGYYGWSKLDEPCPR